MQLRFIILKNMNKFDLYIQVQLDMFLGLGIRDREQNFTACWPELQLGFKTLMITEIVTGIIFIIFPDFGQYLPNFIDQTVEKFQIWRIFFSFLIHGYTIRVLINVLFNIYILYVSMPDIEKRYSTAYVTVEIFIKVFFSNILLVLIGYPLVYLLGMDPDNVAGYGLTPLIFSFMWHKVSHTPQEPTRFCWFPCNIPMKFVPWCYFIIEIFFSNPFLSMIIYCLLGYYEFMIRKQRILKLPLSVYKRFDSWMPEGIINRVGYVKVAKVEEELRTLCIKGTCFGSASEQSQTNERVEVLGTGVSIGGQNVNPTNEKQMKSYWQKKGEQFQEQSMKQEIIQRNNKEQQQEYSKKQDKKQVKMQQGEQQKEQQQPQFQQFQSETISANESSDFDQKSVKSDNPLWIANESPSKQECDQDYT